MKFWTLSHLHLPDVNNVGVEIISTTFFLRLLDVHDVGHEAGVPEDVFRAIFYTCGRCGRYMTERVSFSHNEDTEFDSDDSERNSCIYLRRHSKRSQNLTPL